MNFYCNPLKKSEDIPDPFILRHNGRYYLYYTNPDILCWSSSNLVDWVCEGPAISEDTFPGLVPFAPEVVYWNGAFYMYTSPHGRGHYVLKSGSPTGPFRPVTDNIGHNIDGSVFIDDDGKWYFYWADDSGILGCEMKSPTAFGEPVHTGIFMDGWTEGPTVVKENGRYYLTYTGNHYLSKGYRINAAISDHPLTGYVDCPENPVVVHTKDLFVGLGHSSIVWGPDMLTRYMVYHNLNPDKTRNLNIDAMILDESLRVLGPANFPQPLPQMPDFSDDMVSEESEKKWQILQGVGTIHDGFLVSSEAWRCLCVQLLQSPSGVIEFNLYTKEGEGNYGIEAGACRIVLNTSSNRVQLQDSAGRLLHEHEIPYPYAHRALHALQIRYNRNKAGFYIDGRKIAEYDILIRAGGQIGYFSEGPKIAMGYTAFRSGDLKTAAAALFIPAPCTIPLSGKQDEQLRLNTPEGGEYYFAVNYSKTGISQAIHSIILDGNRIQLTPVAASSDVALYTVALPQGLHEISLDFDQAVSRPTMLSIQLREKEAPVSEKISHFGPYDKQCFGEMDPPYFEAALDLEAAPIDENASAGILLRASQLADGGEGDDKQLGINFFIGYCVSIERDRVILTKHRYNEKLLLSKEIFPKNDGIRQLRVQVAVNDIRIYAGNSPEPLLEYHDPSPILFGKSGVRVKGYQVTEAKFAKF